MTKDAAWSAADAAVASFAVESHGLAKASAAGATTVTATYGGSKVDASLTVSGAELASIRVIPELATINLGEIVSYTALGEYSDGVEREITEQISWSSSDEPIATIQSSGASSGKASALSAGATSIKAIIGSVEGSAALTVANAKLESLVLSPLAATVPLLVNQQYKLMGVFNDSSQKDLTLAAIWSTGTPAIAAFLDAKAIGLAKILTAGSTTVTATFDGQTADTSLAVSAAALTGLAVTPATSAVGIQQTQQYKAIATFADATTSDVTAGAVWTSDKTAVATISNAGNQSGLATGVAAGTAKIAAAFGTLTSTPVTLDVTAMTTFSLSVTKSGAGVGIIEASGINCGATCSASYNSGTAVTLTAAAPAGSSFSGWAGACAGTSLTCNVTMSQAQTVTATFVLNSYSLTVSKAGSGSGTVSGSGINCGATCALNFNFGTAATLTATAATGSSFKGWTGACAGTNLSCTVTVTQAQAVTATFALDSYNLTVTKAGAGSGTVTASGINCGATCSASYDSGSAMTLTAAAPAGSSFSGWAGACAGTSLTCNVTMSQAQTVTATFVLNLYSLTVSKAGSGSGAVSGSGINCGATCVLNFNYGTAVTLTLAAATGSSFTGWTGACAGTNLSCTVTVTQAQAVTATFALGSYNLTVTKAGAGSGTVTASGINCGATCSASYSSGTAVTLTAAAATGSSFTGWTGACTSTNLSCTATVTQAQAVTATFTLLPPPTPPTCGLTANVTSALVGAPVTLAFAGENFVSASVDGQSVTTASASISRNLPLVIANKTYTGTVVGSSGASVNCRVSIAAIGYQIPSDLTVFYKGADSDGRNYYGWADGAKFNQSQCSSGSKVSNTNTTGTSEIYFLIQFGTTWSATEYHLGDVVPIDPSGKIHTKIGFHIVRTTGAGPNGNLFTVDTSVDIRTYFDSSNLNANSIAINTSGSGSSWQVGISRGHNLTRHWPIPNQNVSVSPTCD